MKSKPRKFLRYLLLASLVLIGMFAGSSLSLLYKASKATNVACMFMLPPGVFN